MENLLIISLYRLSIKKLERFINAIDELKEDIKKIALYRYINKIIDTKFSNIIKISILVE